MSRAHKSILSGGFFFVGLLLCIAGCSTTKPAVKPVVVASEEPGLVEILTGHVESVSDSKTVVLRYNPCQCACPPFEVKMGPRWVRGTLEELDESDSPAAVLLARAKLDQTSGLLDDYSVTGTVVVSDKRCDTDVVYVVVSVEDSE